MLEAWSAFIQAISISDWIVIFLTTKPIFIFVTLFALIWTRRGRAERDALPGPEATPLLDAD